MPVAETFPIIRDLGLTAKLVSFAGELSEPANRAALAFRAAVEAEGWEGVQEAASSLASAMIRFDPLTLPHEELDQRLRALLEARDWMQAQLPAGRKLWRIPVALGGEAGPQFAEAAELAGLPPDEAARQIGSARVRVLSIGFAPGQPYMGQLGPQWDIPRMSQLNPQVPGGALVVAIRQLIIFAGPAPTGWRHIGQTRFECFRPHAAQPFALSPGDEVCFRAVAAQELAAIEDDSGNGGATCEPIA